MNNQTLIYILLAALISVLIVFFQYLYKDKNNKNNYLLIFLRFISVFGLLLLLINPKFKKDTITTVKPNLVLLIDDSKSIKNTNQTTQIIKTFHNFKNDSELNKKFNLKTYTFSNDIKISDSINFDKSNTLIYKTLKSTNSLFNKEISPIVLITDGNQTQGVNYTNFKTKQHVFPIIVGDTVNYQDLKITQLNVNKYAYLNHKFPVETFVVYDGDSNNINTNFVIKEGNQTVFSKKITLGKNLNSSQINFYLPSNKVGLHHYKASVSYLKNEKNKVNNATNFSVEIINEQAKILLVSSMLHPDIGMLKRAIQSNKQRKLLIKKPNDITNLNDYQMVILYQPDKNFESIFKKVKDLKKNFLIYTGTKTNWNFLNNNQTYFSKKALKSNEDYLANFNPSFSTFLSNDLGFNNFAPVNDYFGDVTFSIPFESLLFQQIGNFSTDKPLLVTFEDNNIRGAVFLGENSWRWRMASFLAEKSFEPHDEFLNKIIQYLSSTKRADFLEIENKKYFYANDQVNVTVYSYDANYKFDDKAKLWINITNKATNKSVKYPFALQENSYEVNISNLISGNYTFKVFNENNKSVKYGNFSVLAYDAEQQFVGANKKQLTQLAINTNGKAYYLNQYKQLKNNLLTNNKYVAIQKSNEKITPLIDWYWLMVIIALSLSIEWFIRKYKGLL